MGTTQISKHIDILLILLQLNRLLRIVQDKNANILHRKKAIAKLGNLGSRKSAKWGNHKILKALFNVAENESEDPDLRVTAAKILSESKDPRWKNWIRYPEISDHPQDISGNKQVNDIFLKGLLDICERMNDYQTLTFFKLIGKSGNPDFAEPLLQTFYKSGLYIEGKNYSLLSTGEAAAIALSKLNGYNIKDKSRFIHTLKKYLAERRPKIRKSIALTLSKLGEEKWLTIIQGDSNDFERIALSDDVSAVEILIRAMGFRYRDPKPTHNDAKRALSMVKSPSLIDSLAEALNNEMDDVKISVATALGNIKNARSVELLVTVLSNKKWEVRKAAAAALIHIASFDFNLVNKNWKRISALTSQKHKDHSDGINEWSCGEFHGDHVKHTDIGIGLRIPPELKI